MRMPRLLVQGILMLCILSGAALAEVTVSQSNDPQAMAGGRLAELLNAERAALRGVAPERILLASAAPPAAGTALAEAMTARPRLHAATLRYDPAWLDSLPKATGGPEWHCLAQALYFEARGESLRGQFAVAEVVLNRVDAPSYPDSICGVVNQGTARSCQFSFACDGQPEVIAERHAWERAGKIARLMLDGGARALTGGATHFHTRAVKPGWSRSFARTAEIGTHLFYRKPSG